MIGMKWNKGSYCERYETFFETSFETAQKARLLRTNGASCHPEKRTVRPEEARFLRRLEGRLEERLIGLAITALVLLLMLFLTSCSHRIKHDGPPNFYVDETRVLNAVPKPEPLAKYGNMNSYVVFGKRYFRLKSSQDYQAVGVASWYGTQFHARNTSSGEPYNMLAMTAAHKTLPLPTYVEVTNLKNKRTIIVKVNDRGPFSSNRLIDLSYVAAKKLGMLAHGTALVKIKAINPYTFGRDAGIYFASRHVKSLPQSTSSWHASASDRNPVYLQVGAFRNKSNAQQLQQRLISLLATPVKVAMPTDKRNLYRVQVGPFKDMYTANRMSDRLKELGIESNKLYGV